MIQTEGKQETKEQELVSRAMHFAVDAHDGMRRKTSGIPFILHPMEAAAIVGSVTDDQEVIAAAVLHDVVEDAGITAAQVEEAFGPRVAQLVGSETEDKREHIAPENTWLVRKQEAIQLLENTEDRDVKILFLGDKLANMRSIYQEWLKEGDAMWQQFNQKDPQQQCWYYRSVANCIRELDALPAWQEYDKLIKIVFEEGRA